MQYVCHLNCKIFRELTPDMTNDEVVISDSQMEHVKLRHPEDYEEYFAFLAECVVDPDYVIASNKPNTAIVLKELEISGKRIKIILRLQTISDPSGFKNSIITFQHIERKRYNRYIRNGKIIYCRYDNVV